MNQASSIDIQDNSIRIKGNLVIPEIRKLREQTGRLDVGESYQMIVDENASIDSAGLAYLVNMITAQRENGGDISMSHIPSALQQLIALAEVDFIFNDRNQTP